MAECRGAEAEEGWSPHGSLHGPAAHCGSSPHMPGQLAGGHRRRVAAHGVAACAGQRAAGQGQGGPRQGHQACLPPSSAAFPWEGWPGHSRTLYMELLAEPVGLSRPSLGWLSLGDRDGHAQAVWPGCVPTGQHLLLPRLITDSPDCWVV